MDFGSVVRVIASMLVLLAGVDDRFSGDVGGLEPVSLERSLELIVQLLAFVGGELPMPCAAPVFDA